MPSTTVNILFCLSYNSDNIHIFKPVRNWLHPLLIKLGKETYDIQMLWMPQCSLLRRIKKLEQKSKEVTEYMAKASQAW